MPDQRTLLFWAPDLTTGFDGKKTIEFYTSDVTGNYHLVVQGINDDGIAGTGVYDFSVRRNDF
jgi:uncharacterized protein YfaS (alpha-2-macroglobulin family)